MQGSPSKALDYFIGGAQLIALPGFRRFIFIPLLANVAIFIVLTLVLLNRFQEVFSTLQAATPNWLEWLTWILWPLVSLLFFVVYGYSFNIITNLIAAPFFGVLAEKLEQHLTGVAPPDEPWGELIPRTLKRELVKLWYFISRGALVLLLFIALFFIPGANLLGVFIVALWSCWCMAVQYTDYPADNHQTGFRPLRRALNRQGLTSYSYGGLILLGSMIPVVNIFVTPIAVAGATRYWVDELRHHTPNHHTIS